MLSAAYGQAARLRRSWYARHPDRRRTLARPVISVGNLASGGRGKTPVVAALARLLLAAGERPSILSRGYGRRRQRDGVVVVSDGVRLLNSVDESGDEPQMLARSLHGVPVIVSADRYLGGVLAERRFGCTVHLLDDGFQHLQLARDVDLLLVQPRDALDRVLPEGLLREPREAAASADALLVAGTPEQAGELAAVLRVATTFRLEPRFSPVQPLTAADGAGFSTAVTPLLPNGPVSRVVAVAGIAEPSRFFAALRRQGWDVVHELAFADHRWFTAADHARIAAAVTASNAGAVITTEKDAVRIGSAHVQSGAPIWAVLPMEMAIEPAGEFRDWLLSRVHRARSDARSDARPSVPGGPSVRQSAAGPA